MILTVMNMKKSIKNILFFLTAVYCTLFIVFNTHVVGEYVSKAVDRCIYIIIPSLFAMMALSGMLIKTGVLGQGSIMKIFVLSMTAGYPVGAKMLSEEFERENITKKQAELYMSVCFGAGPAFIFGCISDILYGGGTAGIIILISGISVNVLAFMVIMFIQRKDKKKSIKSDILFNSEIFVDSVTSGGKNIFSICIMIVFFSIISCILKGSGIIEFFSEILSEITGINSSECGKIFDSILEVTNIGTFERNNYMLLPFICSAVSFGGICVVLQVRTVINNSLSMKMFIIIRIICAVLSGIVCRILMPFMLKNQTVSVSEIEFRVYSSESPVPSCMLAVMILILLYSLRSIRHIGEV